MKRWRRLHRCPRRPELAAVGAGVAALMSRFTFVASWCGGSAERKSQADGQVQSLSAETG